MSAKKGMSTKSTYDAMLADISRDMETVCDTLSQCQKQMKEQTDHIRQLAEWFEQHPPEADSGVGTRNSSLASNKSASSIESGDETGGGGRGQWRPPNLKAMSLTQRGSLKLSDKVLSIKEEYAELCENEWLDAYSELEDAVKSSTKGKHLPLDLGSQTFIHKLLCDVFLQVQSLPSKSNTPEEVRKRCADKAEKQEPRRPSSNAAQVLKTFRASSDVLSFVQKVCDLVQNMHAGKENPTFWAGGVEEPVHKESQEIFFSCKCTANSRVLYYIYPVLLLGDRVVAQGKVYITND